MKLAVPKATVEGECRVALIPETIGRLQQAGLEVLVESSAGFAAGFPDSAYEAVGAKMVGDTAALYEEADAVVMVGAPSDQELARMKPGTIFIAPFNPLSRHDLVGKLAGRGLRALSLDMMPRISRAQKMDVLSSMSTVAGYKAVLLAAVELGKMFPMLMTAAGTIAPAKVLVLGAGVAGLQAIATARRLGAVVSAFDVRPEVKEQVESLGARFVEVDAPAEDAQDAGGYAKEMSEAYLARQKEAIARQVMDSDIVISTALIPGKAAPLLITAEMVKGMAPGSVIVDLAAEGGGNCELTNPGESVRIHGVTIMGPENLASSIPYHASQMYSRNVGAFLLDLVKEGQIVLDKEDECVVGTLITENGEVVHDRVRQAMEATSAKASEGSSA
jgi:NAD(P) transhydrogenase subunit alpha